MAQQKQNELKIEIDFQEELISNPQKIESPFPKKLKANKQQILLANTADTDMNTQVTTKKIRVPKKVEQPVSLPGRVFIDTNTFIHPDDMVAEPDEEVALLKRLAELKEVKAKNEARSNIAELRKYECELVEKNRQVILAKIQELNTEQLALQAELFKINEGEFDEELITKKITPSFKPKGEKKEPTYEGKGKKAGTGEARVKDIANLNSGKTDKVKYGKKVGTNTWSLMFEGRRDGGLAVVMDDKGLFNIPVFKEVGGMLGVSIKTKQDYLEWVKA